MEKHKNREKKKKKEVQSGQKGSQHLEHIDADIRAGELAMFGIERWCWYWAAQRRKKIAHTQTHHKTSSAQQLARERASFVCVITNINFMFEMMLYVGCRIALLQ